MTYSIRVFTMLGFLTSMLCCVSCRNAPEGNPGTVSVAATPDENAHLITIHGEATVTGGPYGGFGGFTIRDQQTNKTYVLIGDTRQIEWGKKYSVEGIPGDALNANMVAQGYQGVYKFTVRQVTPDPASNTSVSH